MPGVHRDTWIEAAVLWNHFVQLNELLRTKIGERPEQHGVGDGEDCRIRGQPDGQNPDRRDSIARTAAEPAQRLAKIGEEPVHAGTLRRSTRTSSRLFVQCFFYRVDEVGGIRLDPGFETSDYLAIRVHQERPTGSSGQEQQRTGSWQSFSRGTRRALSKPITPPLDYR